MKIITAEADPILETSFNWGYTSVKETRMRHEVIKETLQDWLGE